MIVPMKKVFLVVQAKDSASSIKSLRSLGLLHVEHEREPKAKEISLLQDELNLVSQAIGVLGSVAKEPASGHKEQKDLKIVIQHIIDSHKRYEHLKEYSVTLKSWINQWERWGDFQPSDIQVLRENNIYLRFYEVLKSQINNFPKGVVIKNIFAQGAVVNCLAVSLGRPEISFQEIEPPKISLNAMKRRVVEDALVAESIKKNIAEHMCYWDDLLTLKNSLKKDLEFYEVLGGMGEEESLVYLKGYIPFDAEGKFFNAAKKEGWGVLLKEPSGEDSVPTLMRNPAWVSLIRPMFKLLEIVPGYRELDISPLFLIFFSLFFGMLIGDAGTGSVYLLLTFIAHKKIGRKIKDKSVFFLFYLLSLCAIIWGVLTGNFFGHEWLAKTWVKPLVPELNNVSFIQAFCFFIGALHLSIAHSWRAALKSPSLAALADIGWISIIWAAFFLAKTLLLGDGFPFFGKWLIIAGLALVLFFTSPQHNILKGLGEGAGTIALGLMNNFTDVVSYVRLFAVGLAGTAIADAFNSMAAGVNTGSIPALVGSGLIIIAGQALNIILGPISVLVHGVRLNVLEFCGHANISWSGFSYNPLREEEKKGE